MFIMLQCSHRITHLKEGYPLLLFRLKEVAMLIRKRMGVARDFAVSENYAAILSG